MNQCQHCTSIDRKVYRISVYCEDNPDKIDITLMLCDECILDTENKLKHYINDKSIQNYKYKGIKIP